MAETPKSFNAWLAESGLENYATLFSENEVDFSVAVTLTEADLRELGLTIGARRKLLLAAAALSNSETSAVRETTVTPPE